MGLIILVSVSSLVDSSALVTNNRLLFDHSI
jgi:hypothetical protein